MLLKKYQLFALIFLFLYYPCHANNKVQEEFKSISGQEIIALCESPLNSEMFKHNNSTSSSLQYYLPKIALTLKASSFICLGAGIGSFYFAFCKFLDAHIDSLKNLNNTKNNIDINKIDQLIIQTKRGLKFVLSGLILYCISSQIHP